MLQMVETRNKETRNKGIMFGEMMLQMVETIQDNFRLHPITSPHFQDRFIKYLNSNIWPRKEIQNQISLKVQSTSQYPDSTPHTMKPLKNLKPQIFQKSWEKITKKIRDSPIIWSLFFCTAAQIAKRWLGEKQNHIFLTGRNELFLGTKIKPFL